MYKLDNQRRLLLRSDLLSLTDLEKGMKVAILFEGNKRYRVMPIGKVPAHAKIVASVSIDAKNRLIIPKPISDCYKNQLIVYIQDSNLYFEFEEYADN